MKSIFPATYSTLCPKALSSLISEKYGISEVHCKLLVRGVGDTYLVESHDARFILRIYRSSHRSLAQIEEEVKLLLALKEADVSVSYPIADISGKMIVTINAVEGERNAVLFSYAAGSAVRFLNDHQLRILGNEMAKFHHVSSDLKFGQERWTFDLETTIFKPLETLQSVFTENPDDHIWLQGIADRIKIRLAKLDSSGFSKGYCHFDFLPKNFHFDGDKITFFDFDFMGQGWLVNDIMTFWVHLTLDTYMGRMTYEEFQNTYKIFLDGYREYRSISDQELAAIPYLAIGFWLFYMRFHTTHDQFYAFSQPAQLKSFVGFIRNIVENYWDKEN
ncbi:phosphotransferase enzyme family protein [Chryseobacterium sp. JK1]|uniref:phosphotransferase enzyme family protein n=1 Tax=Chryseobacterium sp. JK1 TaxID=874294 RepID=UPI003D693F7E